MSVRANLSLGRRLLIAYGAFFLVGIVALSQTPSPWAFLVLFFSMLGAAWFIYSFSCPACHSRPGVFDAHRVIMFKLFSWLGDPFVPRCLTCGHQF